VRFKAAGQAKIRSLAPTSTLALAVGLFALTGCGSSSTTTSSSASAPTTAASAPTTSSATSSSTAAPAAPATSGEQKLSLASNPEGQLKYDTTSLTAKAGKVSIDFTNKASLAHNLTIESGGTVINATPTFQEGSKTLSVTLKAGTYKFYCSVPGHRAAGMEGTLTVQ
jgi:plastocyanin